MSPLLSMIINVLVPSLILSKGGQYVALEPRNLLFLALTLPLIAGIYEFIRFKKTDFISIFGFVI